MRAVTRFRERGGVMVIVAIMLGTGSLLGAGAITVDVGQIYAEREELQSGADAAALAVVTACHGGLSTCAQPQNVARDYAERNARDKHAAVSTPCGRGWNLPTCAPQSGASLTGCIGEAPDPPTNYVEVRTSTDTGDGTVLPPMFARTLVGNGAFQGARVAACARAVPGGPPTRMVAPAVTVERCYYDSYTNHGTSYPTTERVVHLKQGPHVGDPCDGTASNGANGPGNFGWLSHGADCTATINANAGMYAGQPGNENPGDECVELFDSYIDDQRPMPLPLFDRSQGQGRNFEYHVTGFAAFVITGYRFSGSSRASYVSGQQFCSGEERCLYGYFVEATFPVLESGGPEYDYGITSPAKIVG